MTKKEFELLSSWASQGFWDVCDTDLANMDADEILKMSLACQVMARIKLAAGGKRNKVTEAFVKQYSANVQMIHEQMSANVEELIDPTMAYEMAKTDYEERTKKEENTNDGN